MRSRKAATAFVAVALMAVTACGTDDGAAERSAGSSAPEPVVTTAPEPTAAAPPPTDVPPTIDPADTAVTPVTAESPRFGVDVYRGLGVWVDVFDWATAYTSNPIGVADIDHMAAEGAQTLYIQTNRYDHPDDALEPQRLDELIDRARSHGMGVVAWYLPTMVDLEVDLRRLLAAADLDVDGLAVDIESLEIDDVAERTRRLVQLSHYLRTALPDETIGAIVLEPVVMEDVNPDYWRGYPWAEMAPLYDVWLPMAYWTNRVGPWRSAHDYIATNVTRVRERIGQPDALVHAVGGIGDDTTVADLEAMAEATAATGTIGASIYDYRTTQPEHWEILRRFRV